MVSLIAELLHRQRLDEDKNESAKEKNELPSCCLSISHGGALANNSLDTLARKRKRSNSIPGAFAGPIESTWSPDPTASAWSPVKRSKTLVLTPPAMTRRHEPQPPRSTTSLDSEDDGFFSASSPPFLVVPRVFSPPGGGSQSPSSSRSVSFLLRSVSQPCVSGTEVINERRFAVVRPWSSGSAKRRRPHVNFFKMAQSRSYESLGFRPNAKAKVEFWSSATSSGPPLPFAFGNVTENEDFSDENDSGALDCNLSASYLQDSQCELDLSKIEEN